MHGLLPVLGGDQEGIHRQRPFVPITYKDTWKPIREVAERSGTPYNRAAFEAQQKRDAEAAAKKAAEDAAKAGQPAPAKP